MSREDRLPLFASGCGKRGAASLLALLGLLSAFALVLCLPQDVARAAVSATPSRGYVTNGPVYTVVPTSRAIYIGGNFTQVGPRTGPGVGIDASTGKSSGLAAGLRRRPGLNAVAPTGPAASTSAATSPRRRPGPTEPRPHPRRRERRPELQPEPRASRSRARGLRPDRLRRRVQLDRRPDPQPASPPSTRRPAGRRAGTRTRRHRPRPRRLRLDRLRRRRSRDRRPARENIAALDATTGAATSWNPNAPRLLPTRLRQRPRGLRLDRLRRRRFNSIGGQPRSTSPRSTRPPAWRRAGTRRRNEPGQRPRVSPARPSTPAAVSPRSAASPATIAALDATTRPATPGTRRRVATGHVNALAVSGSTVYAGGTSARSAGRPATASPPSTRPPAPRRAGTRAANG